MKMLLSATGYETVTVKRPSVVDSTTSVVSGAQITGNVSQSIPASVSTPRALAITYAFAVWHASRPFPVSATVMAAAAAAASLIDCWLAR